MQTLPDAIVYTETVVHSAPERFAAEAPYQIAIVEMEGHERRTVRIRSDAGAERVEIGERMRFVEYRDSVPVYERLPRH